jgi:hypothetical protein
MYRPRLGADRPVGAEPKKPEGDGFGKMNYSVLADRPGCMTGPSATAFIWHLTTHLMHSSR